MDVAWISAGSMMMLALLAKSSAKQIFILLKTHFSFYFSAHTENKDQIRPTEADRADHDDVYL